MSRIGRQPIFIPRGVTVTVDGATICVAGPKGKLTHTVPHGITVSVTPDLLTVQRTSDERRERALHGLTRTLIANMIQGVTSGFSKELEIVGIGYRAEKSGKTLKISLGYSHPIVFEEPEGITISVDKQIIKVEGIDKCLVGQTAATIRKFRKPDVYKGKGIRYVGEQIRTKVGKAGAK
ncbi:MAG: 50S ribosomal protein L6 [Desulfobacterota bacterium]|nr:50S ribosomal protein L6 [Thermodesulfobacteriota bacterium]